MRHPGVAIAAIVTLTAASASAQQPQLNDTQRLGQALFVQSCGVCHLKPQLTAPQFGPVLSRESASGNENGMRQIIANGSPRMPGFKYHFNETQIAAIASYLKTVPPRAPDAPPAAKREGREAD
jgi:mono/diheme cytochrome c family protein